MTSRTHTPEDIKTIESKYSLNIWERALGWRKRQMIIKQLDPISNKIRNDALEEVAKEFEAMKNGGDTTSSFAAYVRSMKRA
jgi:hypothetical protein